MKRRSVWYLLSWAVCVLSVVSPANAAAATAAEQLRFADGLYARGMYVMAVREYLNLIRDHEVVPDEDAVLFRVGECYRFQKQNGAAARFYQRVVQEHPQSKYRDRSSFRQAEAHIQSGKYPAAATLLESLSKRSLDKNLRPSVFYFLGYVKVKQGDAAAAEKALNKVINEHADSAHAAYARLELAALLEAKGEADADAIVDLYEKAAAQAPTEETRSEALFRLADRAFRARNYKASAKGYSQLIKSHPDHPRIKEAILQVAWSFYYDERLEVCLDLIIEGLKESDPETRAEWIYLKANCERKLGYEADAQKTYSRLLKLAPDSRYAQMGGYEQLLIDYNASRHDEVVRRAKLITPTGETKLDFLWLVAESQAALGHAREAIKGYQQIIEQYPESKRVPETMFRLAGYHIEQKNNGAALALYQDMQKQFPKHDLIVSALFGESVALAKLDQFEKAIGQWTRLTKKYSKHELAPESLYQVGLCRVELGQDEPARKVFGSLIERYPATRRVAEAQYWSGVLAERRGYHRKAEQGFQAALAAKPPRALKARCQFHLVTLLQKDERPDEAATLLQDLLDEDIVDEVPPALLEWLALYRMEKGEARKAVAAAEQLAKHSKDKAWKQIGWALAGKAWLKADDKPKAKKAFQKAVKVKANTREGAESALSLAALFADSENWSRAEELYGTAGDMAAGDETMDIRASSYYGLAKGWAAQKKWKNAARYYMSVAVLYDDGDLTPECLYRAAEAFDKIKSGQEATAAREELKTRYPKSEWVQKLTQENE